MKEPTKKLLCQVSLVKFTPCALRGCVSKILQNVAKKVTSYTCVTHIFAGNAYREN